MTSSYGVNSLYFQQTPPWLRVTDAKLQTTEANEGSDSANVHVYLKCLSSFISSLRRLLIHVVTLWWIIHAITIITEHKWLFI